MDAFKGAEMARMDLGGNNAWKAFWDEREGRAGLKWENVSLEERYSGEVGEEWKERLACRVEGREFTGVQKPPKRAQATAKTAPARAASPGVGAGAGAGAGAASKRKEQNEAFFARMGGENAKRTADLPPSQGGKYSGFGSEPAPSGAGRGEGAGEGGVLPGVDEFQKDPVAALTKGLGWFTTTVGRGAKTVNDGWIQPTAQKVRLVSYLICFDQCHVKPPLPPLTPKCTQLYSVNRIYAAPNLLPLLTQPSLHFQIAQSDLQTQARLTAAALAQNIQTGTKGAAEQFNKFIEGGNDGSSSATGGTTTTTRAGTGARRTGGGGGNAAVEPDRRDFWDSFGEEKVGTLMGGGGGSAGKGGPMTSKGGRGSSAIGTAAMKKGNNPPAGATPGVASSGGGGAKEDGGWEEW